MDKTYPYPEYALRGLWMKGVVANTSLECLSGQETVIGKGPR